MFESDEIKRHEGRFYGLYRAFVYDNKDPQNQGRLKLQIPSVLGIDEDTGEPCISDWAYPMFPVGGNGWGIVAIPPVYNPDGTQCMVWVAFEMGDISCPVWMGCPVQPKCLQSDAATNSNNKKNGVTSQSMIAISTPNGNKLILDDEHAERAIVIKSKNNQIVFNDKESIILINGRRHTW